MVKGLGVTIDEALYNISYSNLILYGASLPTYNTDKDKKKGKEVVKMDDPRNNDRIKNILNSLE